MAVGKNYNKHKLRVMNKFRLLWEQHVEWTRMFIIGTVDDLDDISYTTNRLLRNPADFANELKKYYGAEKAGIFEKLFTEHLVIAAQFLNNAKTGNTKAADDDRRKWYANADNIAEFLSDINPYFNEHEWRAMLYDHLYMTENQAVYRFNGQYEKEIEEYDTIEQQALRMADMISEGIIKQFKI